MIASLPMYWRAETASAWQGFWSDVQRMARDNGLGLPDLTPPSEIGMSLSEHWLRSDLALSMTCSLPLRTVLRGKVTYVGTFCFDNITGLGPGLYNSTIIARTSAKPHRLALNSYDSQSGWAAVADQHRHLEHIVTGSHAASLEAVATGAADVAYLDSVTWRLLERVDPNAAHVTVRGVTAPTPGLPLIAAEGASAERLRPALAQAAQALAPDQRETLGGLSDFVLHDAQDYLTLPLPPGPRSRG